LAEFLQKKGIVVICPSLKGHTGKKSDLKNVSYHQWIQSAEKELHMLSEQCSNIVIIGFSMGGLISINFPYSSKVKGIALLNTPIYPWNLKQILINIIMDIRKRSYGHIKFYATSIRRIPLSAAIEFVKFLHVSKPRFREIKYPLFIGQALADDTVQPRSADYIYRNASSPSKAVFYYGSSGHLICHSKAAPEVFKDVLVFIEKCCNN